MNAQAEEEEALETTETIGLTEEEAREEAAEEAQYLWGEYKQILMAAQKILEVVSENELRKEEFIKQANKEGASLNL